ncbi:MAG: ABC transporter permease [Acidobacteria bacterium]|nr:ABC transporter permease [Acidobacteriota bacterium]
MNYELAIALRYLWTARKQLHTAFLSVISALGLAVGVATLLLSLALLSGLQLRIKSRLISSSPHVLVEPVGDYAIDDSAKAEEVCARVASRVEPYVSGLAWVSNARTESGRPVRVRSTDPAALASAELLTPSARGGSVAWITRSAAAALRLRDGDRIVVVGPRTRLTPFGAAPVFRRFADIRIVDALPDHDGDAEVLLTFDDAAAIFMTAGRPTAIALWLDSVERVDAARLALEGSLASVSVKTWKEINRPLFLALRLEKVVMFATISLIVLVAALNLICSLAMLVVEKRSRIGILRTLGATESSIRRVFLFVGLLIGITGTLAGNVAGLGFSWLAERYHLVPLPGDSFGASNVPFAIELPDVLIVNAIAVTLSIIAAWYPASIASRLDPITAIREE